MKHTLKITLFLVLFFLIAQITGLIILNKSINDVRTTDTGEIEVVYTEPVIGERPDMEPNVSFWYIIGAVLVGTGLVLLIIKFRKVNLWKVWFFLAVWLTTTVALGIFVNKYIAYAVALFFAAWKIWRPNVYVHNLTELFMYAGIAVIFVPILNVFWTLMLLLVISVYDMYAVWKSKHMVKMANFQTEANVFAGFFVPYSNKKGKTKVEKIDSKAKKVNKGESRVAVLGGGDIAFPLIFSGAVMQALVIQGLTKINALLETFIVTAFVTIALSLLLVKSEQGKFYPAMPFITLGCLVGYGIVWLINFLV